MYTVHSQTGNKTELLVRQDKITKLTVKGNRQGERYKVKAGLSRWRFFMGSCNVIMTIIWKKRNTKKTSVIWIIRTLYVFLVDLLPDICIKFSLVYHNINLITHAPVGSSRDHAPLSAPVAIGPGAIQFKRMPYLPHSDANDLKIEQNVKIEKKCITLQYFCVKKYFKKSFEVNSSFSS